MLMRLLLMTPLLLCLLSQVKAEWERALSAARMARTALPPSLQRVVLLLRLDDSLSRLHFLAQTLAAANPSARTLPVPADPGVAAAQSYACKNLANDLVALASIDPPALAAVLQVITHTAFKVDSLVSDVHDLGLQRVCWVGTEALNERQLGGGPIRQQSMCLKQCSAFGGTTDTHHMYYLSKSGAHCSREMHSYHYVFSTNDTCFALAPPEVSSGLNSGAHKVF
jgi:hypothetical protein